MKLANREFNVFLNKILIKRSINVLLFLLTLNIFSQNLVSGGVTAGDDIVLDCYSDLSATLQADFFESYVTDDTYTVASLPMDPVTVTLPSELAVDDGYSEIVDLGFTFCYFGEEKTQIQIGDNGTVSFKIDYEPLVGAEAIYKIKQGWNCPHRKLPKVFI